MPVGHSGDAGAAMDDGDALGRNVPGWNEERTAELVAVPGPEAAQPTDLRLS